MTQSNIYASNITKEIEINITHQIDALGRCQPYARKRARVYDLYVILFWMTGYCIITMVQMAAGNTQCTPIVSPDVCKSLITKKNQVDLIARGTPTICRKTQNL
jgi:hypothetical protein